MKISVFFIFTFLTMSCAQRIKVPINRMIMPEAIGVGAEIEYRDIGYSSGVLNFDDNSTENPLLMGVAKNKEFYLGVGIANSTDLFIRVPEESSSLIGIKVQIVGEPVKAGTVGHSVAFTMGMGSERDKFDQGFSIDLKSDVSDFSLIHGYRLNPYVLLYDGVSVSNYSFEGTIQGGTGLNSDIIEYAAKNILGGHAGVAFGGSGFKLKLEWSAQKITWTHTEEKMFQYFGMALTAGW
jgi:hypothetical protein